ncbi:MAG TPA: ACT domain-containing protein [Treponemataceae bacterium]|jgi:hypothetical protein|nr:amino acid-binding protein [Treponema sp.]HOF12592.1 ACT domain-containing protein [Treponemataceae bacterium]HZH68993.1 ACT domain-containing protein [Flavobacteriaceae bacterium]HOQ93339.1 ACT domain-containing protein [Treponemataceae bacterium]HPM06432.1 ACT domain-containing protein [Treponemataceae bacterium]
MGIQQISIFLENTAGRIADVTGVLKDAGINLRAIMIADTADFGILRVIADDSEKALAVLKEHKFTTRTTDVLAVHISDAVGSLHEVLTIFDKHEINIEYIYASLEKTGQSAVIIFKIEDCKKAKEVLCDIGFDCIDSF